MAATTPRPTPDEDEDRADSPPRGESSRGELRRALYALTQRFVTDVMELHARAVRAELREVEQKRTGRRGAREDTLGPTGRRIRRGEAALMELSQAILSALSSPSNPPGGLSVSQLAAAVESTPRSLTHPLARLLADGAVEKRGERKGTRYHLPPRSEPAIPEKTSKKAAPPKAPKKVPKKSPKKSPKKVPKKAAPAPRAPKKSPKKSPKKTPKKSAREKAAPARRAR